MPNPMKEVYDYLNENKYPKNYSSSDKRSLRKRVENFVIQDGVLYYCRGWKLMSEEERQSCKLRETVWGEEDKVTRVMACHTATKAHLGHQKLVQKLAEDVYWVGMHADIRRIIKRCRQCQMKRECIMDVDSGDEADPNEDDASVEGQSQNYSISQDTTADYGSFEDLNIIDASRVADIASQFWEVVELEIIGPFPISPDSEEIYYVAVFVDEYSAWPEAFVMENAELATLMMALFSLFCKWGTMKTLVRRGNNLDTSLEKVLANFSGAGCPVAVTKTTSPKLEATWAELKKGIEEYIVGLPTDWFKYMEFCLLPYRISRAESKDYTPSYLVHGKEMRLPQCIDHQTSEKHVELHLSDTQIQQSHHMLKDLFFQSVTACSKGRDDDEADDLVISFADDDCDADANTPQKKRVKIKKEVVEEKDRGRGHFYQGLLQFKQGKGYPPNSSVTFKRNVRKAAPSFVLINNKLFHKDKRGLIREVVITEKERFKLLQRAHVDDQGNHVTTKETHEKLMKSYFWRGFALDTRAFVQACPECAKGPGRPKLSLSLVKIEDSEKPLFEDCTAEFQPIIEYLKTKTVPAEMADQKAEIQFKTKTNSYCLKDSGELYHKNAMYVTKDGTCLERKVIFTPAQKQACLEECHLTKDSEKHKSKRVTHNTVSEKYYWPQMAREVAAFMRCCPVCSEDKTEPADTPSSVQHSTRPGAGANKRKLSLDENSTPTDVEDSKSSHSLLSGTKKKLKCEEADSVCEISQLQQRKEKFIKLFDDQAAGLMEEEEEEDLPEHENTLIEDQDCSNVTDLQNVSEIAGNDVEVETEQSKGDYSASDVKLPPLDHSDMNGSNQAEDPALPTTSTPASLNVKKERKVPDKYKCRFCGLLLGGPLKLQIHLSKHTGEKPFTCKTCGAKVSSMRSIRQHTLRHSGQFMPKKFLCDLCGQDFRTRLQLKMHKHQAHPKSYPCSRCETNFPSSAALTQHEEFCSSQQFPCEICSHLCLSKRDHRVHILSHVGLNVRPRLERVGPRVERGPSTPAEDQPAEVISQEVTLPSPSQEGEVIRVEITLPEGMELNTDGHGELSIEGAAETVVMTEPDGEGMVQHISEEQHSLLQLAEQVVQATHLTDEQNVQYEIIYPDNTRDVVFLPAEEQNT